MAIRQPGLGPPFVELPLDFRQIFL
jgi:hypothetical protein